MLDQGINKRLFVVTLFQWSWEARAKQTNTFGYILFVKLDFHQTTNNMHNYKNLEVKIHVCENVLLLICSYILFGAPGLLLYAFKTYLRMNMLIYPL